jgi:hypothetical protein
MSKADFKAKIKEITAIRNEDVKQPNMPVGEAVQEAENLVAWCEDDKVELAKVGLDWLLVEDLTLRAGACRYAQSIWAKESQSIEEAQKMANQITAAFDLRDKLVHHFTFAFRKEPELLSKVQIIREGYSLADMLQDLSDLNVLGKENVELLKAIGLDLKLLDEAAMQADELSVVLARANGESGDNADAKDIRDKTYTYMKLASDEIREVGQYVFYRDSDRKKGYVSQYLKRVRIRSKNNGSSDETSEN